MEIKERCFPFITASLKWLLLYCNKISQGTQSKRNLPKKKLTFASSPPPIQHEEIFVEEPKFKSVEVQSDFSFVDTPIYFPSNEEAIVNIDHDYSILPSVTNSLASISISFSHFQDKEKQQFEEINKLKLKVTNLQEAIETLLSKRFSVDMIKHDNGAVRFYTGFPNCSSLLYLNMLKQSSRKFTIGKVHAL